MMKHILLIDPEGSALSLTQRFLENYGFKVKTCSSVSEALDLFPKHDFHLIISEIEMKGLDGFDLCRILKRFFYEIPMVFLTNRDDRPTQKEAKFAGVLDVISKQSEYTSLPIRIRKVFELVTAAAS